MPSVAEAEAAGARAGIRTEHVDTLVVGAGISGIAAAYHLSTQCPGLRYAVLESQDSFGGTWLTHRYPGIRSDSDLHTFGYRFKPWTGTPIATAPEIRAYMGAVIDENGLAPHIHYGHTIESASWSSQDNLWTVHAVQTATGKPVRYTANFLWMCQGYYRHAQGYTPEWPGMAAFGGRIVHPQNWPADLDCTGKRVVVIGSGATAATLVPALAGKCEHVTMLQRSPTYFITGRNANALAEELRQLKIDETWVHEIVRRKILRDQAVFTRRARDEPDTVKQELLAGVRNVLGPDYDIDTHFTPSYRPWRQRIAFIPDGDLFQAIRDGHASVATDEIERFEHDGLLLKSGKRLPADVIVTATGFDLNVMGDIRFSIDGQALDFADTVTYRGMMFTGVPNLAWVFGYFRASWTLRADLVGDFVCRLLAHMQAKGVRRVVPALRPEDRDMPLGPWVDPENFNPGYLARGMHLLPKQGDKPEWQHTQDYWSEKDAFAAIDLDDPIFVYGGAAASGSSSPSTSPPAGQAPGAAPAEPPRVVVHARGIRTSVIDTGRGRPTILVHGTSSSAQNGWLGVLPRLAEGRRCLALDLAGSGETRDDGRALTLDALVSQVEAVAGLAGDQPVDLIGYSLGGVVAAAAAARLSRRVRRLVVLGGWAQSDLRMQVQFDLWRTLARNDRRQLANMILLNGVSDVYFDRCDAATAAAILDRYTTGLAPGSDRQAALDATIDIRTQLAAIQADTLVIGLTQDRMVPPAHGRAVAEAIPGARHAEIDCGHLVMLEQPARLLELILRHLDG